MLAIWGLTTNSQLQGINVLVENCTITSGDDAIAVKAGSGSPGGHATYAHYFEKMLGHGSENMVFRDIRILHRWPTIGSNCAGHIRNITFTDMVVGDAANHLSGLFIKTWSGNGGTIEDITWENMVVKGKVAEWNEVPSGLIRVTMVYHTGSECQLPCPVTGCNCSGDPPKIKNVRFRNIRGFVTQPYPSKIRNVTGQLTPGIFIGLPNSPIDGIVLENVTITDPNGHTPWTMVGWNCTQAINVVTKDVSPPWPTGTCTRPAMHDPPVYDSPTRPTRPTGPASPFAAPAAAADQGRESSVALQRIATAQVPVPHAAKAASLPMATSAVVWHDFLSQHDLVWSWDARNETWPSSWETAAWLGNGLHGLSPMVDPLLGQMRFEIARTDVYSCGYDPRLPIGFLLLQTAGTMLNGTMTQRLYDGSVDGVLTTSKGEIRFRAFTAATSPVSAIEWSASGEERSATFALVPELAVGRASTMTPPFANPVAVCSGSQSDRLQICTQRLSCDPTNRSNYSTVVLTPAAEPGAASTLFVSVGNYQPAADQLPKQPPVQYATAVAEAYANVRAAMATGIVSLSKAHASWWADYYETQSQGSFVSIGEDRRVEVRELRRRFRPFLHFCTHFSKLKDHHFPPPPPARAICSLLDNALCPRFVGR